MRAFLYDAAGTDKDVQLDARILAELNSQQLLWIDVNGQDEHELREVSAMLGLTPESVYTLLERGNRPRLDHYGAYSQLNVNTIEEIEGGYRLVELDFVIGANFVLTVHSQPVAFLASFDRRIKGDSNLGRLDAPSFLSTLLDWHLNSYFRLIEGIDGEVDRMDSRALRPSHQRDLLVDLSKLRHRVAFVRRTLTPHREIYAAMSRPDFQMIANSHSAGHFAILHDRLERAIEAAENARELLIGSFDIFSTQTTLRTNEAIKTLTLVSVVLLPATVIVSIGSLLLKTPVYSFGPPAFWGMLALILVIGLVTVGVARWRKWI
jgi:Mg2+ and Co2+ transporter CorA